MINCIGSHWSCVLSTPMIRWLLERKGNYEEHYENENRHDE